MTEQEEICLLTSEGGEMDNFKNQEDIKECHCNRLVNNHDESCVNNDKSEWSLDKSEFGDTTDTSVESVICDNNSEVINDSVECCPVCPSHITQTSRNNNCNREILNLTKTAPLSPFNGNSTNCINNISTSINEFRDTIGICEVRPIIENDRERNGGETNDSIIINFTNNSNSVGASINEHSYPYDNSFDEYGSKSLVSNTEIMEILSDLDSVLDNSILANSSDTTSEHVNSPKKVNNKLEYDMNSDYIEIDKVSDNLSTIRDNLANIKNDLDNIKGELIEVDDELQESLTEEFDGDARLSIETRPIHEIELARMEELTPVENAVDTARTTIRESGRRERSRTRDFDRRSSMRLVSPMQMPSAPSPSPPPVPLQELSLSAQLFLETQDPERYSHLRPSSASAAPRERGRRASTPRRCTSLHVQPRSTESTSTSTSASSSLHSSPFHITVSRPARPTETAHRQQENDDEEDVKERWPVRGGAALALLSCTLSGYSICRFALLTLHFGANFLVQFLLLSVMFGIPLLCLFASFGRALNAGPLGSWRVAPLFRGLGAALLVSQVLLAAYYVAGLSWLLVYFRDSFVSQNGLYRWADPFPGLADDGFTLNTTTHLPLSIPAYLSEVVLRRSESPTLPFQSLFHICLLWVGVALIVSKGLASYGNVVFVITLIPVMCLCAVSVRLLCISPTVLRGALPYTNWGEFFINSKSWSAAAGECFMTWGLLAPTVWSLCGSALRHRSAPLSPARALVPAVLITLLALLSSMLLAGAADTVIREHHYYYTTTSYEHPSWWVFLTRERGSYPRHANHHSMLLGVCVSRAGTDPAAASGLQPLRLATEIFPAAMALLSTTRVSSFWSILFYSSLIFLSISQLSALTWGITAGIVEICPRALRSRRGVLSLACCSGLLLASLPLAHGLELVHLLDYGVVGIWWQCLLQVLTLAAIFLIRGRPYAADALASTFLSPTSSLVPILAFTWNVILPIAMIVECVVDFKVGRYKQVISGGGGAGYWGGGARAAIALLQLLPPLLVPLFAVIQCWRYLSKGPPDILDRIQLLYRPVLDDRGRVLRPSPPSPVNPPPAPVSAAPRAESPAPPEDPPPKYTPPPSYSTATGARLAKLLTSSIRRSIRRVHRRLISSSGEGSGSGTTMAAPNTLLPLGPLPTIQGYRSFREKKGKRPTDAEVARSSCTLPRLPRAPSSSTQPAERLHHSSAL